MTVTHKWWLLIFAQDSVGARAMARAVLRGLRIFAHVPGGKTGQIAEVGVQAQRGWQTRPGFQSNSNMSTEKPRCTDPEAPGLTLSHTDATACIVPTPHPV